MKKWLIGLLLETIFDALLNALVKLAVKSSNNLDDQLVILLNENRTDIIKQIKAEL